MENNNKKGLKPEQKQQLKKYAVFALMLLVFGGSMWFIFKPSEKDNGGLGLNTELPMPQEQGIIRDKISAFEQEKLFQKEPVRSLESFSSLVGKEEPSKIDLTLKDNNTQVQPNNSYSGSKQPQRAIQSSATAYKGINKTLGNFYEKPKVNPEDEKLQKEIEDLKSQLAETQKMSSVDEQLLLMEKSYQLAAKYMPESSKQSPAKIQKTKVALPVTKKNYNKIPLEPVRIVSEKTVSALQQSISDSAFIEQVSQPRNFSFITAGKEKILKNRNTIWACVSSNQKLINGQNVRLRLLEPIETGGMVFPKHAVITGIAQIKGERLHIFINSLEHGGNIIPVQLTVYDTDGQQGLFIPGSIEVNAIKEITASMGRDAGTSISISQGTTAGQQLAADVGRSFIQGASQYISKKMRTTKVTLKAGHRLLLMANNQN